MRKLFIIVILASLSAAVVYYLTSGPKTVPKEKVARAGIFLKTLVAETLEKDYQRHNITITASVVKLEIDRITQEETPENISYDVRGRVTYIIKGKREWRDAEGNVIRLDPESEITRWFSCEIYEDRYGEFYKDKYRNHLILYADKPSQ
jgi:hypothetical protein